jgi:hypothetical protein
MAQFNWPVKPIETIQRFETKRREPEAGALILFAVSGVDSLYYLDDLDKSYDRSRKAIGGHPHDVIDVAHCRWASGTCITALDLCAAGLARVFCGQCGGYELSIAAFDPKARDGKVLRKRLPAAALKWIDRVRSDVNYKKIKKARRALTHARLRRHWKFILSKRVPERLVLEIDKSTRLGPRDLIELARDVATKHVIGFLEELPKL